MTAELNHFRQAQVQRLSRFAVTTSVDIHCHCLPGLDDGPPTLADALALCRALVDDGITTVIATPHQLGAFDNISASTIRAATAALQKALDAHHLPLTLMPGAEVRVDDRFASRFEAGEIQTLAAGAYLLLELPHSTMIDLRPLIDYLTSRKITPILSHPERQDTLTRSPGVLMPWIARGALLQVTAGSLTGHFGPAVQRSAWEFVDAGWVSLIATDAHDIAQRSPTMTAAIEALASRLGHALTRRLCIANPQAVLNSTFIQRPVLHGRASRGSR
jgi:protein-tyrosine phosphatase